MRLNQHRMVYLSLVAALIMQLLPWSGVWIQIKPDFVLLVLLYWMLRAPHLCNIGTAWVAGLICIQTPDQGKSCMIKAATKLK